MQLYCVFIWMCVCMFVFTILWNDEHGDGVACGVSMKTFYQNCVIQNHNQWVQCIYAPAIAMREKKKMKTKQIKWKCNKRATDANAYEFSGLM